MSMMSARWLAVEPADLGLPGAALLAYWSSLPRPGGVPARRDFDPMRLACHLPIVSVCEYEAAGVWRVRLAGSAIVQRAGLTGVNYLDLLPAEGRKEVDRALYAILAQPCGALGIRRRVRPSGLAYQARSVALPLLDADGRPRLIVSTNEEIRLTQLRDADPSRMLANDRRFIDIGAGIPCLLPQSVDAE